MKGNMELKIQAKLFYTCSQNDIELKMMKT